MNEETAIAIVGRAIQMSVAPVFLISGVAAMLAVMTNRLSRIVDRGRMVEAAMVVATGEALVIGRTELASLTRRAKAINLSITLCTITALLICAVVASLFVGVFLEFEAAVIVAGLFVSAMTTFFAGLLCFLREIFIATATVRIGPPSAIASPDGSPGAV